MMRTKNALFPSRTGIMYTSSSSIYSTGVLDNFGSDSIRSFTFIG